ncbi:hypothetical protein M2263_001087 [Providencia alcalifaciens]|nr:hypothetical protein [Providencia alcalifaciens]MCW2254996.1 hypothetical protein [Providencia alcalifaciens]
MGSGLEIYDKKGRLIIGEDTIVPRHLGNFQLPLGKSGSFNVESIALGGKILCHFRIRYRFIMNNTFGVSSPKNQSYLTSGSTINYEIDYPIYKWENNGAGTGGTRFYDSFTHHVTVWAI